MAWQQLCLCKPVLLRCSSLVLRPLMMSSSGWGLATSADDVLVHSAGSTICSGALLQAVK